MKLQSNQRNRWYLCECTDKTCREEIYLPVSTYEKGIADGFRFVKRGHSKRGERTRRVGDDAAMIDDRRGR